MHTQNKKPSALRTILNDVYSATDRESVIRILENYFKDPTCVIRPNQRRIILLTASRCQTLTSLLQYVTNSFLYYEGNGIIKQPFSSNNF